MDILLAAASGCIPQKARVSASLVNALCDLESKRAPSPLHLRASMEALLTGLRKLQR